MYNRAPMRGPLTLPRAHTADGSISRRAQKRDARPFGRSSYWLLWQRAGAASIHFAAAAGSIVFSLAPREHTYERCPLFAQLAKES